MKRAASRVIARRPPDAAPDSERRARLERIWRQVAAVPRGRIATYGGIAAAAGLPRQARLVGYALRVAPADLNLPWHRIVNAAQRSAFPVGSALYARQRRLLAAEGVRLVAGRVAATAGGDDLDALLWGAHC